MATPRLLAATALALLVPVGGPAADPPVTQEQVESAAPDELADNRFLVAARHLLDPNFANTVVLLLSYGEGGAMGLVINRPTELPLGELLPAVESLAESGETVWFGGPVAIDRLMMLVRAPSPPEEGEQVFEDVYLGGGRELLERLAARPQTGERFRVYAGYAGWAPGQLEAEVGRGDWAILPADADTVFESEPEKIWSKLIERSGVRWTRRLPDDSAELPAAG